MPDSKPRPFTRAQALQNAAFLRALARTGNVREAARTLGVHRATFTKRRAKHPAFAAEWDATLALVHARLNDPARSPHAAKHRADPAPSTASRGATVRTANGRLQLRRPAQRRLTREAEQAFLLALSATANVRLSAAAAGFSHATFYHRRRQSPAFAREMRLALQTGYERVEMALLESFDPSSYADDAWRHNEPPPIPSMTPAQALQLLYLHQKEARLWAERPDQKQRRGESSEMHSVRLALLWWAQKERDAEERRIEAAARAEGEPQGPLPHEPPPPLLPALDQVTGWSKAGQGRVHDPDVALFGGWRLGEMEKGK
jgi:hypothetical protein